MNAPKIPNPSEIVYHDSGITLAGPDAVNLYRAATIASGLRLYARTGMLLTRGATPTHLLALARGYTGKAYKGKDKYIQAAADMKVWLDTMKAALPVTDERTAP